MRCPGCNEEVSVESGYCPECGYLFDRDVAQTSAGEFSSKVVQIREKSASRRRAIRALVVIAAIAAILMGSLWYCTTSVGVDVEDSDQFPDSALQDYIEAHYDTDANGILSGSEIKEVTFFGGIEGSGIRSLEGLEVFDNLETIDVSNSEVETLFNSTAKHPLPNLRTLILNGSQVKNLVMPYYCEALEEVYCTGTGLESVEMGEKSSVRLLDCSHNVLSELDLTEAESLRNLNCSFNNLTRINLSYALTDLNCSDNNLEFVHFDQDWGDSPVTVDSLYCQNNELRGVFSGNSWSNNFLYYTDDERCDISNNPGIWKNRYEDGRMFVECDYSSINDYLSRQ